MSGVPPVSSDRYEQVRDKLRERGYLEGRVERFFLGDLLSSGSAWRPLLRSALKAGLVAGPLLGALLAAAVAAYNRPLLRAVDLALLWVYLSLLASAALVLLDLGAALLLTALARRRGPRKGDAIRAALLVGLPVLAYLALIWWNRGAPGGVLGDVLFVGGAVLTTILAAWLAGLVSLAGIVGRTGEVPDRQRRPARLLAALLVPLGLALIAARMLYPGPGDAVAPSPFGTRDDAPRLLFVGVDGLDAGIVQGFESGGAVSSLLACMRAGTVFPMRRAKGQEPAEVWTTILTGMSSEIHGVRSAGAERLPGVATPLRRRAAPLPLEAATRFLLPSRTVPASGAGRPVRTLWEIVELRRPAAALGWWATWPAGPFDDDDAGGYVVSDRVLPKLISGAAPDRDTWPASLFARLAEEFPTDREAMRADFRERFALPEGSEISSWLWESYLIDAYSWRVGSRLAGDERVRALFVYLPGLDILRNRLNRVGEERDLTTLLEIHDGLELYVRWLDGLLGRMLRPRPGWQFLLVADPGREAAPDSEGFVLVAGPDARTACVGPSRTALDVAPLALSLLGFPVSSEMPGRLPQGCLAPRVSRTPSLESYGRRAPGEAAAESEYDPEMVERLRSLGYLR